MVPNINVKSNFIENRNPIKRIEHRWTLGSKFETFRANISIYDTKKVELQWWFIPKINWILKYKIALSYSSVKSYFIQLFLSFVRQTCLSFFKNSIPAKFSGMYSVEELCDKETQVQQHNNHTIWFVYSILLQTMMMGFVMNILIHSSFQHVRSPLVSFSFISFPC